jgi:hypothetical protein
MLNYQHARGGLSRARYRGMATLVCNGHGFEDQQDQQDCGIFLLTVELRRLVTASPVA